MVAMAFQRGGPLGGRGRGRGGRRGSTADEVTAARSRAPQTYEEYRDMSCLAHLDPATGKSTHTNRNCKWVNDLKNDPEAGYKRARKHRPRGKGGKGKNKDKEEDSSEAMDEDDASPDPKEGAAANKSNHFGKKSVGAYHTFLGTPTVYAKKSVLRLLNATVPAVPQYVKWSEKACTFDRSDHPAVIPKECYALVVSPRIDGFDFSKCLMDGGACLNIMYLETLERMNLTKEQLKHNTTEFHGVVPGKKANSLGSIKLPVDFGDVNNYREEMITFEVVPFKSSYHVIFGRPTYHKFLARACYIYNKLKIPGPNGMITKSGDYKKARDCEEGEASFVESVISGEELQGYRAAVDPTEMQTTKKQISEQKTSFKAAIETKKNDLIIGDGTKQIRMKKSDQKATLFITPFDTYCYVTMPFGLKNAGATYQRTMQRCLKDQIGRNVHAYIDDIAVMTRKGSDLISDLTETFENLRRYKMMLNPLKCVFGVPAGKLRGFIVSHRGIEVVSRLGEKALPLYKLLKKTDKFVWDDAADAALQGLKDILTSPPILAAPVESEPMLLWQLPTESSVSSSWWNERKKVTSMMSKDQSITLARSEAVLPTDIIHDSPRVSAYDEETADEARQLSVDLIEEARNLADQRSTIYQQKLRRYHSRRVRNHSFMVGDLILRLRQVKDHKLQTPWEGPFVISKVLHNRSYYLVDFRELKDRPDNWYRKCKREDPDDIYDETDRPWNIAQLRPFHT
ncbi:hypothetical protein QYE76_054400 [Lolium multiflorum]|uniref:Reverse transcriptase domain-containing protein n=1 Tax=Lolium multiflorum TaxID=4521 RepID=A0AAD8SXM1_LOLMU|nr:hypothetical protein QYE76_054400 [Lolium multiflorum]